MSSLVHQYRNGKIEKSHKYENILYIWYTKAKDNTDQITVATSDSKTYSSWGLSLKDIELTQRSHENASEKYNTTILAIGKEVAELIEQRQQKKIKQNKYKFLMIYF